MKIKTRSTVATTLAIIGGVSTLLAFIFCFISLYGLYSVHRLNDVVSRDVANLLLLMFFFCIIGLGSFFSAMKVLFPKGVNIGISILTLGAAILMLASLSFMISLFNVFSVYDPTSFSVSFFAAIILALAAAGLLIFGKKLLPISAA